MRGSRFILSLAIICLTFFLAACASSARGRLIERSSDPKISEREVRAHVNAHLLRYSSMVEFTVYEIGRKATDPTTRLAILYWQMNGIATCRGSAFLDDPLAAALDCWVLGRQEIEFYKSEKGKKAFGDYRELIVERLESVHIPFQTLVASWQREESDVVDKIEAFAAEHPLGNLSYGRDSLAPQLARIVGDANLSAIAAVGTLDERIQDITERLNIYMQQIPKQLRWTTDLIKEEMNQSEEVNTLIQDVHSMNASLQRLSTIEDRLPQLIYDQVDEGLADLSSRLDPAVEALDAEREKLLADVTKEREATLAEIDRQRLDTLAFATAERKVMTKVLDDKVEVLDKMVQSEITAVSALIDKQMTQVTEQVKGTTAMAVKQADAVAETRISQLAWSLFFAGAGLLLLFFGLRWASLRYLT